MAFDPISIASPKPPPPSQNYFLMPVLLDGLQVPSVSFSLVPLSVLSSQFRNLLPSNSRAPSLLVTTLAGHHNAISFPIAFQTVENASTDVVLGLDWAALLRDSLLGLGYCLDSTFDAWRFASDPSHPIMSSECHEYSTI